MSLYYLAKDVGDKKHYFILVISMTQIKLFIH